ncbi:MAG TPA: Wzz/FepE/Etk N-terminal domain-containing protein [Ktedonobacteraceae bacterium]|nr:Wzz/FepE/Etk N-terminal domain-containing protein [Ktedonobacteraceae bacterium]
MNLNLSVIVRALVRWSWVLIIFLIVGFVLGKVLTSILPPQYQATSLVQLNGGSRGIIIQPVASYANLVSSDSVLGEALKQFPHINPASIGTKQLTVTPDTKSNSISIQVSLPDGKDAAGLANALAQLLVTQQNALIKQQTQQQLQLLQASIKNDQSQITSLTSKLIQVASQTPPGQTPSPANQVEQQQLQNQITNYQNRLNTDQNQYNQLVTDQTLYGQPLTVVQTATVPTKPSGITGVLPLGPVSLVVMFLLGLASIFFLEKMVKRVNSAYGLQKEVSLPTLGSLRWTSPSPLSAPLLKVIESKRPYGEDCRVMMADVLFHAEDAGAHILAITAQSPQSGVSCVASELAALLAQSKRRVLLIDANLHNPVQHKRLGIPNDAGLARMLEELRNLKLNLTASTQEPVEMSQQAAVSMMETRRVAGVQPNQAPVVRVHQQRPSSHSNGASEQQFIDISDKFPFDSYIVSTSIQNLYALPAGKTSANPASLLSMPEMEHFLRWASRPIDYVIIDCPALTYAEAHVLGGLSDQTYLVVDATRDRVRQVEATKDELLSTGVKISGLIVNKLGRWI